MSKILTIIFILVLFASPFKCFAANPLDVIINEVAWMGTTNSANDEWIELYNNTESPINFDGWQLVSQDGTPKVSLSGIIYANGFYLLERTDDNTIPGILADKIHTGALGNNGELLKLSDSSGNLIDEVNCSDRWFAGDNSTKQTMEKINSLSSSSDSQNWQTSQNSGGTPKAKNSIFVETSQPGPTTEPAVKDNLPQPQQPITYSSGVVFNEILPSPEGPDAEEEWIVPTITPKNLGYS